MPPLHRLRRLARRILQSVWLILLLIALNFMLIHLAPGDPVHLLAGQSGDEQYFAFIREKFGLDQPLTVSYVVHQADGTSTEQSLVFAAGQATKTISIAPPPYKDHGGTRPDGIALITFGTAVKKVPAGREFARA